jgi:hypothetical protein
MKKARRVLTFLRRNLCCWMEGHAWEGIFKILSCGNKKVGIFEIHCRRCKKSQIFWAG